ncbi:MAG: hypothetical protein IKO35_04620, partial [Elusimicrobiaceae bacterium]|nr:hypothetical protein [Elusimicrobiaceae bacterium]
FAMLIGCISGVYSTIALTTPLVYTWSHGQLTDASNPEKPANKANVETFVKEHSQRKHSRKNKRR